MDLSHIWNSQRITVTLWFLTLFMSVAAARFLPGELLGGTLFVSFFIFVFVGVSAINDAHSDDRWGRFFVLLGFLLALILPALYIALR